MYNKKERDIYIYIYIYIYDEVYISKFNIFINYQIIFYSYIQETL